MYIGFACSFGSCLLLNVVFFYHREVGWITEGGEN